MSTYPKQQPVTLPVRYVRGTEKGHTVEVWAVADGVQQTAEVWLPAGFVEFNADRTRALVAAWLVAAKAAELHTKGRLPEGGYIVAACTFTPEDVAKHRAYIDRIKTA